MKVWWEKGLLVLVVAAKTVGALVLLVISMLVV